MTTNSGVRRFSPAVVLACALGQVCMAETVMLEHFDDNQLDPAWDVSFLQEGSGWTWEEAGTSLTVTDVVDTGVSTEPGVQWGAVRLSQSFAALSDFHVHMEFSWDSGGADEAMQRLALRLKDGEGSTFASAMYHDSWWNDSGGAILGVGDNNVNTGAGWLGLAGSATLDITRVGDLVEISWDDQVLYSDTATSTLDGMALEFWYYAMERDGMMSVFGTESVDLISISGTPVPTPAVAAVMLAGLIGVRRRRRS